MLVFDFLRKVIGKYGMWGSIFLTTIFAIVMSIVFTFIVLSTTKIASIGNRTISGMWTAATVALLLTPLLSYVFFKLICQLDEAETEARTLAQTDALTGVMNRRYLSEISHKILTHPQSYPITGILLDMNDFKQVNDEYGHLIGDQMLISFCECVRAEITETDIFGRFGGDEFALLLPQTDQKGAIGLLDRISSRLEMLEIKDEVGRDVYISLSAGVISMNVTNPIDFEYLVRHADQGLYKAKKKSRNSTGLLSFEIIQKHN